ncbi:hypothetical protein BJ138DRAFT_1137463 [Hygrophoropsis aurantiaca]|uniref:Uncharacterized protein n=1 Tax=Hygrophoropsis aurantiaca TaxID=72124 RepID=A0ACB8A2V2_9AGAM|nr:hypothetical protein BJ138DRAFT_1137463 [Hygrophoropsis aurantiaca]
MSSQALPPLSQLSFNPDGMSIWRVLLAAEAFALNNLSKTPAKYNDPVIGIRVLGFFLKDFWDHSHLGFGSTPYECLVHEISSRNTVGDPPVGGSQEARTRNEAIIALGLSLRNNLMRVDSFHPSFEVHKSEMIKAMAKPDKTKKDVKEQALVRDGYACMITGLFDDAFAEFPEVEEKAKKSGLTITQCAHLFSESAQSSNQDHAAAFAILSLFGLDNQVRRLHGGQVNSLHNVLTMSMQMHVLFNQFRFWLEEVPGMTNTYDVCSYDDGIFKFYEKPRRQKEGIPPPDLPDRTLIAIRSAWARVARLSGAIEQMDQIQQDREDTMVLENDWSTADLLGSLLLQTIQREW